MFRKIITGLLLCFSSCLYAQTTGSIFALTGDYIKIGVSDYGTIGSKGNTSPGILYDNTGTRTFNTSYDYLTPGTPFEGFTVKYTNGAGTVITQTNNNTGATSITGGILTNYSGIAYASSTFDNRAVWTGNGNGYSLINDVRFNNNQKFVDITTTLTSSVAMTNLYFGRFTDPDARAAAGDSSATTNTLGFSPIGVKQVVFSEALSSKYALGLYSAATNVGAGISSGWTTDPIQYYNGVSNGNGDYTIGLGFLVPSVAVGDIVTFQYAYIFGPSTLTAGATAVSSGAGGGTPGVVPGCTSSCDMEGVTTTTPAAPTVVSTSTATVTVSDNTVVNTGLPVITASTAHHVASQNTTKQTIARETTTNVTTPFTRTITTLVRTTTTWSDGSVTTSDSATSAASSLVNDVVTSVANDSFSGRIDQQAQLSDLNKGINRSLDMDPFRQDGYKTDNGTFYTTIGNLKTTMADGYSSKSDISAIAFDRDVNSDLKIGGQYSLVSTRMPGVDSLTKQEKQHFGVYSVYKLPKDLILSTNIGSASNDIGSIRNVEGLFRNYYATKGTDSWISNKVYSPELSQMIRLFAGYTFGTTKVNSYTEMGSIQSARAVDSNSRSFDYAEFGAMIRKNFDNKISVTGQLSSTTDGYLTASAGAFYSPQKNSNIGIQVAQQQKEGNKTDSMIFKVRMNF